MYLKQGRIHSVFGVSGDPNLCISHLGIPPGFGAAAAVLRRWKAVRGPLPDGYSYYALPGQRLFSSTLR